jgi:hypothetical protein
MSFTKNGTIKCDYCGKFSSWDGHDEYTPYGSCVDYEPPDPVHFCAECAKAEEDRCVEKGCVPNHWIPAHYEIRARERIAALLEGGNDE